MWEDDIRMDQKETGARRRLDVSSLWEGWVPGCIQCDSYFLVFRTIVFGTFCLQQTICLIKDYIHSFWHIHVSDRLRRLWNRKVVKIVMALQNKTLSVESLRTT
jgi:hypothetical protein